MSHERIYYCKYTIFLLHTFFCLNLSETAAENYVHETTHIFDKHLYILYVMPLNYLLCEFIYIQLRHTHTHIRSWWGTWRTWTSRKKREAANTLYYWNELLVAAYGIFSSSFISVRVFFFGVCALSCRRPRCIKFRSDANIYKLLLFERWPRDCIVFYTSETITKRTTIVWDLIWY